jgi:hypothetical protein
MQRKFCHVISWPGALSNATYTFTWAMPSDCKLVEVSACQSNATAGSSWTLGTDDDPNGFVTAGTFGVSGAPQVYDSGDFDGDLVTGGAVYPRLENNDNMELVITGGAANQATDGMIVFTFVEG